MPQIVKFIVSVIHSDVIPISFLIYFAIIGQASVTTNYNSKILDLMFITIDTIIIYRRIRDANRLYSSLK